MIREMDSDGRPAGTSWAIDSYSLLSQVPASHQHLLSRAVEEVFEDPSEFMGSLAERCRIGELKRYLEALAMCDEDWQLELHHFEPDNPYMPAVISEVYFRFFPEAFALSPGIGVPPKEDWGKETRLAEGLHPSLQHLYSLIDGINAYGFMISGGWFRADEMVTLEASGVGYDTEVVDGTQYYPLVSTSCGELFLAGLDGDIHLLPPEGPLTSAGGVDPWLEKYFEAQMNGIRVDDFYQICRCG